MEYEKTTSLFIRPYNVGPQRATISVERWEWVWNNSSQPSTPQKGTAYYGKKGTITMVLGKGDTINSLYDLSLTWF